MHAISPLLITFAATLSLVTTSLGDDTGKFTETFDVAKKDLSPTGKSSYFVLEPGFVAIYEGKEHGRKTVLTITVTSETKVVDGVKTRVVEEKETAEDEIVEISRNFFAISKSTGDVYYFGEESDTYKNGKVANRAGSWMSGVDGAHFGLAMPAKPKVGAAYYQEHAPGKAMDRAEVVSVSETVTTPAGEFKNCVKTKETTPLEMGHEFKFYAAGVGLIKDSDLSLVKFGSNAK